MAIACVDTIIAFLSGFFIFGIFGFLMDKIPIEAFEGYMGGAPLLYGTVPFALSLMTGSNAWCVFFYATIFVIGIDSSISYVETVITALLETPFGRKTNRLGITILVCLVCFLCAISTCANFGSNLIDVTDFFLGAYLITFIVIIECFSIGWVFDLQERIVENA